MPAPPARDGDWLHDFHAGARSVMERCYREHYATVARAVGRVLRGADQETVIQDVFLHLLSDAATRQAFNGTDLSGWIATLAHRRAIDFWRRHRRERPLEEAPASGAGEDGPDAASLVERTVEARLLMSRFRDEVLPARWAGVFDARFVRGLDQRAAAGSLGIHRSTLAYQELRVRRLLRRFLIRRGARATAEDGRPRHKK